MKTRIGASLIPVWHCHFIPRLHEWTLHVVKRDCDAQVTPYWIGCRRMRVRYPFQTPRGVISCWSEQQNRVYMTSEWVFVPEWKSRPGTVTGVNSRWYDSLWYEILCWCHVNEYRATRGNWSELVPEWKSYRYHVNTPLDVKYFTRKPFQCNSRTGRRLDRALFSFESK